MENNDWRARLTQKIEESGKSMRAISIAIGKGEAYTFSIVKYNKIPSAETLVKICEEVGTSVSYVLFGYEVSAEEEKLLRLFSQASPAQKAAILTLLQPKTDPK